MPPPDQFYVNIHLVVISKEPNKLLTLKDQPVFPVRPLRHSEKVDFVVSDFIFQTTGLTSTWAIPTLLGVVSNYYNHETIDLAFAVYIPEPVRISGEFYVWSDLNEIYDKAPPLTASLIKLAIYNKI